MKISKSIANRFIIYLISILFILCSCTNKRWIKDVEQFMGQQITVSSDLSAIWNSRDTVIADFTQLPIKLIVWYDSLICGSCEISKMYVWDEITTYADSLAQWFSIVFLFSPKKEDLRKVNISLKTGKFDYPVFIDHNATFAKQNKLPKNRRLHTFLLDKNNNVVLIGSPLYNPSLWTLYQRTIQTMMDNEGILPKK